MYDRLIEISSHDLAREFLWRMSNFVGTTVRWGKIESRQQSRNPIKRPPQFKSHYDREVRAELATDLLTAVVTYMYTNVESWLDHKSSCTPFSEWRNDKFLLDTLRVATVLKKRIFNEINVAWRCYKMKLNCINVDLNEIVDWTLNYQSDRHQIFFSTIPENVHMQWIVSIWYYA